MLNDAENPFPLLKRPLRVSDPGYPVAPAVNTLFLPLMRSLSVRNRGGRLGMQAQITPRSISMAQYFANVTRSSVGRIRIRKWTRANGHRHEKAKSEPAIACLGRLTSRVVCVCSVVNIRQSSNSNSSNPTRSIWSIGCLELSRFNVKEGQYSRKSSDKHDGDQNLPLE